MNKIHNVIWSKAQNAWVVVAEGSKACSKAGSGALKVMIALIMLSPAAGMATTLPQGGDITVGQGTITTNGSNQMVIKQNTDKLGINWQSFNVGADGHVIFDQPGTHSIALNRVIGSDGSSILGKIDANGQVFLINPNGVIFGKDSKVNVGGLVASTLNITDADFTNGNYKFSAGVKNGEIQNLGSLQASEGGYIALIGKSVKNQGLIQAKLGTAALASGDAVTLDFSGDGLINIQVDKSTIKALVDNKGLIKADGGNVLMTARSTNSLTQTVVNNDGVIQAQTIGSRNGKIFLDGGFQDGAVRVAGTLDASAPVSGNGGFIETSGKTVAVIDGAKVTTKAANGKTGKWLVDPTDFTISSGYSDQSVSSIGASTLMDNLRNTSVELQTSASGSEKGNIKVNSDVTWDADTTLTLTAHGDININANITANGANSGLALNYGDHASDDKARVSIADGRKVYLNGANATYSENGVDFTILHTAEDLKKLNDPAYAWGRFALANDIDASETSSWNGGLGYLPAVQSGVFNGTLNGLNHDITGLYINRPTQDNVGLIGNTQKSHINNIGVFGSVTGKDNVGLVVGNTNQGVLFNVRTGGSVNGQSNVGGVVGNLSTGDVERANSSANVEGTEKVGGVLGSVTSNNVKYAFSTGNVTGTNRVGGIIGDMSLSSLNYGYSLGTINGDTQVGGVAGYSSKSDIGTTYSSGLVNGNGDQVGGLVGRIELGSIDQSFSTARVYGNNSVGGLAGSVDQTDITNAYATGTVTGENGVGGLIGTSNMITLKQSYATGRVSGSYNLGGLIGSGTYVTLEESFWDTTKTGMSTSAGGVGHADLTDASIFSNWDIALVGGTNKTWRIYDGQTGPLLKAFMGTASGALQDTTITYKGHNLTSSDLWLNYNYTTSGSFNFFIPNGSILTSITSNGQAIRNAGTYTLDGLYSTQFGYDILSTGTATLTVNKATLNIDAYAGSKYYDGTTGTTVTFGDDRQGTDNLIITGSGAFEDKNAGIGKAVNIIGMTVTGSDAANYIWSTPASATADIFAKKITVSAVGANKTYDATTSATVKLSTSGIIAGDDLSLTGSASFGDKNAGVGKTVTVGGITLGGADAGNYQIDTSGGPILTTATINKANLIIGGSGQDKIYDGTKSADVWLNWSPLQSDDVRVIGFGVFSDKNAGAGKSITVTGLNVSGADAGNYVWSAPTGVSGSIIARPINIDLTGVDKTYDGTKSASVGMTATTIPQDPSISGLIAGDDLKLGGTASFSDKNAGSSKVVTVNDVTLGGADAGNYQIAFPGAVLQTTATINKASLNVSGSAGSKVYDGSTLATGSVTGNQVSGDDISIGYTSAAFNDKNAGLGKVVTFNGIYVTGADAGNYTWAASSSSTADISKAILNVTASGHDKIYDGSTAAGVLLSDNRIGADDLSISAGSSVFNDKNAGAGKAINVGGIMVAGADAQNYSWNTTTSTTADISKANLNVLAVGHDKTYNGSTAASVTLNDNRIGSDELSISSSGASFADKNAGTGKTVSVGGIMVTGTDAQNYTWNTLTTTTANILKALLNISATAQNKAYDGTTAANVTLSDNRVAGDDLTTSAGSSAFADKNAGSAKNVTVNGITLSGADAANYTFNTIASTTADVSKASLTVKANSSGKVEGATDGALSWSLQNGSLYGSDAVNGSLVRDAGESDGVYGIHKGTLSAGSNYDLTVVPGTFVITKAPTDPVDPTPPVVVPPVVVPPVVVNPKPPVVTDETKALENTKQIISTITVATKQTSTSSAPAEPVKANQSDASAVIGDYRLLNLGMKLPDEIFAEDSSKK